MSHLCDMLVRKGSLIKVGRYYMLPSTERKKAGSFSGIEQIERPGERGELEAWEVVAGWLQQILPERLKSEAKRKPGAREIPEREKSEEDREIIAGWVQRSLPGKESNKRKKCRPNAAGMGAYVLGMVMKEKRRAFGRQLPNPRLAKLE